MAEFDIFNPQVSVVAKGIEGKTILVYGDNSTGKTKVASELPKPLHLTFENGINAIAGLKHFNITSWADFKKLNKALTKKSDEARLKELYQTIIFDTVKVATMYCEEYVCNQFDVTRLNDANNGFGAWKEFEKEFWREIDKLTSFGYTVYFIAHPQNVEEVDPQTKEKYIKKYPDGDKRTINPICDLVDIIAYLQPNGMDENGKELPSSAYFVNTREFKARSRFDYMVEKLDVYSAEYLQKAIADAVEAEEEAKGIKSVTYEEKKAMTEIKKKTKDELLEEIKPIFKKLSKTHADEVTKIVEEYLGEGARISEATDKQTQQLEMILSDLQDLMD